MVGSVRRSSATHSVVSTVSSSCDDQSEHMVTSRLVADAADVRRFLVKCRGRTDEALRTYGEVQLPFVDARPTASDSCWTTSTGIVSTGMGEPDLTALVVNRETRLPGKFGSRYADAGRMEVEGLWRAMLARVTSYDWPRDATPAPSP